MAMFQVPLLTCLMVTVMESPGWTLMLGMTVSGAGRISHHAEYCGVPLTTSCSVPAWMRLVSPELNPSIPVHTAEYVLDPPRRPPSKPPPPLEPVTVGTVHVPLTLVYALTPD